MPEERRGMQGNTGECQGNVWEWVQSARGIAGECRGMPGERMGVCKLPGECRECRGTPGERMRVGV